MSRLYEMWRSKNPTITFDPEYRPRDPRPDDDEDRCFMCDCIWTPGHVCPKKAPPSAEET